MLPFVYLLIESINAKEICIVFKTKNKKNWTTVLDPWRTIELISTKMFSANVLNYFLCFLYLYSYRLIIEKHMPVNINRLVPCRASIEM